MKANARAKLVARLGPIVAIVFVCAGLLFLTHYISEDKIIKNKELSSLKVLRELLPLAYSNDIVEDSKFVSEISSTVYRARTDAANAGLVFMPLEAQGYSGPLTFAMGVNFAGEVTAIRIIKHRETPGLGDAVDQDISPWIYQFDSRFVDDLNLSTWAVREEGGEFDAISGATITSRNVINKVRDTLIFYRSHRAELFE